MLLVVLIHHLRALLPLKVHQPLHQQVSHPLQVLVPALLSLQAQVYLHLRVPLLPSHLALVHLNHYPHLHPNLLVHLGVLRPRPVRVLRHHPVHLLVHRLP